MSVPGRTIGRLLLPMLAATALLIAPPGPSQRPVAAAEDGLRVDVAATYTLRPSDGLVRVVLDAELTNQLPNRETGTTITRYFFDEMVLGVPEQATGLRATTGDRRLGIAVDAEDDFELLTVRLARNLFYRQTERVRVQFDLPGGLPRSASPIRVGEAFASFHAWAYGDDGLADVTIVVPEGFEATPSGSSLSTRTEDGATVLTASDIDDVATWLARIDAERPDALTDDRLDLGGGQRVTIRAWPEDDEWQQRVSATLRDGLPALRSMIGLDWPVESELDVLEVHTPLLEGYAGVYFLDADEIQIGEDLDEHTILHEASHAWFNGDLWAERWIYEGLSDTYGALALEEIKGEHVAPGNVASRDPAAVPLNGWRHPGRIDDEATDAAEQYGYQASWRIVDALVDEIGVDAMREVLAAADAREIAYVGRPAPEEIGRANGWRRFLDLLEERGGSQDAETLFRRWVVVPAHEELLDERAAARDEYRALVETGEGWLPPLAVRRPLATWDFDLATEAIEEADAVLDRREAIEVDAEALDLDPPASLRRAYESADRELGAVGDLAAEQQDGLDAIEAAIAAIDAPRDPLVSLGLWDATPEQDLADARAAWEADDHERVVAEAEAVAATLAQAPEVGRTRALTIGGIGLGVLVLAGGSIALLRRRGRPSIANAAAGRVHDTGPLDPYATLPGHPPPVGDPVAERPGTGSDEPP